MKKYAYEARDNATNKIVKSTVQADSENAAAKLLTAQGFAPLKIEAEDEKAGFFQRLSGRITTKDKIVFTRQLATLIDADFRHELIDLFTQVVNGNVEEVVEKVVENNKKAKGTQTRRENKQLNDEAVEECGKKGILPMKFQEGINIGVLGMTATKYKKLHDISEPFNDNLPITLVDTKNLALLLGAQELRTDPRKHISNAEGRAIGKTNGIRARIIFTDKRALKYLDKLAAGKKNNKKPKT
jgi:hypothetical protein